MHKLMVPVYSAAAAATLSLFACGSQVNTTCVDTSRTGPKCQAVAAAPTSGAGSVALVPETPPKPVPGKKTGGETATTQPVAPATSPATAGNATSTNGVTAPAAPTPAAPVAGGSSAPAPSGPTAPPPAGPTSPAPTIPVHTEGTATGPAKPLPKSGAGAVNPPISKDGDQLPSAPLFPGEQDGTAGQTDASSQAKR